MCALTTRTLTAAYVGAYVGDAYVGDAYVGAYVMDDRRRALAAISRSRPVRRDCPQTGRPVALHRVLPCQYLFLILLLHSQVLLRRNHNYLGLLST